jgi:GT2 family glycosyltransferase
VFRINYPEYRVIVCDNNSSDGSVEKIKAWADGRIDVPTQGVSESLRSLSSPPVQKPVAYVEYSRAAAEQGGSLDDNDSRLILVTSDVNLGFAGGNNVGLRYLLHDKDCEYVWLLNNDTVIESDALTAIIKRITSSPQAGMCGSSIFYYHQPDVIWALGGCDFTRWNSQSRCIANGSSRLDMPSQAEVEARLRLIAGASLLVTRSYLENVGLMCEDYFLYFEEPDWAFRGLGKYSLAYAPNSIVYHKVGASTSLLSSNYNSWYVFKNQLLITYKFYPWFLPSAFVWSIVRQAACRIADLAAKFSKANK